MKRLVFIGQSIILYSVAALLLWGSTTKGRELPIFDVYWWILLPGILVIKDLFLGTQGGKVEAAHITNIDWQYVIEDVNKGKVSQRYGVVLVIRRFLFPLFFIACLLYVLIEQVYVWDLHTSLLFLGANKGFLMIMTLVLGVVHYLGERHDSRYEKKSKSVVMGRFYFVSTILLSVVGGYIVLNQLIVLKGLGMLIANIIVVMFYLIGVLLSDDENELNK